MHETASSQAHRSLVEAEPPSGDSNVSLHRLASWGITAMLGWRCFRLLNFFPCVIIQSLGVTCLLLIESPEVSKHAF